MISDLTDQQSSSTNHAGSAMAVDFGSVNTRVVIFDVVDGEYRLIARASGRTTDGFPVNDLAVGLDRVLREINSATGRELMADGRIITPEQSDRTGVDNVAVTASLGRPLRAVVVGLMPDVSIASAFRATAGAYIDIAETITLGDGRTEQERMNTIILNLPDIIFIVGGTEDGARTAVLELCAVVRTALAVVERKNRATVIYAGNNAIIPQIEAIFKDVTTLFVAENVRPSLADEQLDSARRQLGEAFDHYKENRSLAFAALGAMSNTSVSPTAQSYNTMARYMAGIASGNAAILDVGSATGLLAVAINHRTDISIRTDLGMGHSATLLLDTVGIEAVNRWLPFAVKPTEIYNYAANKSLRPATIPMDLRGLHLEHALLRAAVKSMIDTARPAWDVPKGGAPLSFDHLIGAGASLTNVGHPGYTALLMLDAIEPAGITRLEADPYGVIPAIGALADENPEAVVQLFSGGALEMLGTAVSPTGKPREGRTAMKVSIDWDGETYDHEVEGGHVWVFNLPPGETASVSVRCSGEMNINGSRRGEFTVEGGKAGVIFDARGRPLLLGETAKERAAQIPLWVSEATGDEIIPIDATWLEDEPDAGMVLPVPSVDDLTDPDEPTGRKRRSRKRNASAETDDTGGKKRRGLFRRGKNKRDNADDAQPDDMNDADDTAGGDDMEDLRSGLLS